MEITAAHYTPIPRRQMVSPIFHIYVDNEENLETHVTDGSGCHAHIWPCDDEYYPGDDPPDN